MGHDLVWLTPFLVAKLRRMHWLQKEWWHGRNVMAFSKNSWQHGQCRAFTSYCGSCALRADNGSGMTVAEAEESDTGIDVVKGASDHINSLRSSFIVHACRLIIKNTGSLYSDGKGDNISVFCCKILKNVLYHLWAFNGVKGGYMCMFDINNQSVHWWLVGWWVVVMMMAVLRSSYNIHISPSFSLHSFSPFFVSCWMWKKAGKMQNKYIPKLPRFRIWRATVTVSFPCDLPVGIAYLWPGLVSGG